MHEGRAKKLSFEGVREALPVAIAKLFGTTFGAGLSPLAPGTCGTLVAVPLAYWLAGGGRLVLALGTAAVFGVGVWAADVCCEAWRKDDDQRIVIDEVAGYLVTVLAVDARNLVNLIAGFVLFRILDAWKPGPIRTLDREVHGGLGVMIDDVAAGVVGALLLVALERSGGTRFLTDWISAHVAR